MGTIWELDFYSRPILDKNQKKVWEVLICESPTEIGRSPESLYRYAKFCSNQTVNSLWLREAIEEAMEKAQQTPKKIRFFRRQMKNMITKACEDAGIDAAPSRRTYALTPWLEERLLKVYPQQPGYDPTVASSPSVQYPATNPVPLPDAVRGDRGDKWTFVSLEASALLEMSEWDIAFGEAFPLQLAGVTPQAQIPGLLVFSPRAIPFAGWMSGIEIGFLRLNEGSRSSIILETGASESWILANLTNPQTLSEAKGFEETKRLAQGVHFLAIQSSPESESFAGFWLLKQDLASKD